VCTRSPLSSLHLSPAAPSLCSSRPGRIELHLGSSPPSSTPNCCASCPVSQSRSRRPRSALSPSSASALSLLLRACSSVFPGRPAGVFLRAPFFPARISPAAVVLSASARDRGRVHRVCQRSVVYSTVVAVVCLVACSSGVVCCTQHSCLQLARVTLARLLVVTTAHSLFVHRASRVLAFVVELLNLSSLTCDFVVARARANLLDPTSPARSKLDLVVVPYVIKKSYGSGEDEASSMIFTKCSTKSSNKSSIVILVYAKIRED
jgi:hypothetical protein